jgi:methionyl-tRNA synthetase
VVRHWVRASFLLVLFEDHLIFRRFDYFGRTSTPLHTEYARLFWLNFYPPDGKNRISQEIYLNLKKNDNLVRQEKEQTYCEDDQK